MVYWNKTAISDIDTIFRGLLEWKTINGQTHLTYDAAVAYLENLRAIFDRIDLLYFHHKAPALVTREEFFQPLFLLWAACSPVLLCSYKFTCAAFRQKRPEAYTTLLFIL